MKKVSFIVALVVSALVIGCQENQFNPISSDSQNAGSVAKKGSSNPDGVFELNTQVTLGNIESAEKTYDVIGQIQYTLVPSGDDTYAFSVVTEATLESVLKNGTGNAYGESIEPVFITGKEVVSYERVYRVVNLKDIEFNMHVEFSLSADEVQISNIWLSEALPNGGIVKR